MWQLDPMCMSPIPDIPLEVVVLMAEDAVVVAGILLVMEAMDSILGVNQQQMMPMTSKFLSHQKRKRVNLCDKKQCNVELDQSSQCIES